MAGPLDTGQQIATYLYLHIIPLLHHHLLYLALPKDSKSFHILAKTIAKTSAWRLQGHSCNARPKKFVFQETKEEIG
jgi:hypothetical protein